MSAKSIYRRQFLRALGVVVTGAAGAHLLGACQPQVVEVEKVVTSVVKETVEVEKIVKEAVEVEKQVVVTATPEQVVSASSQVTPAPAIMPGGNLAGEIEVTLGTLQPNIARGEGLNPLVAPQHVADRWAEERLGCKVKWREAPTEGREYAEWTLAQIVGGTVPDVLPMAKTDFQAQAEMKGWVVNLDGALNLPNPYVKSGQPGSERWKDLFFPQAWMQRGSYTGHHHYLPYSLHTTGLYYNKDLFASVGVDFGAVTDWDEMIQAFQAVKDAGHIPTLLEMNTSANQTWWLRILRSMINDDLLFGKVDLSQDQNITQPEWAHAIRSGIWDARTDEWWEAWRILLQLKPYIQEGYLTTYDFTLFTSGKAASVHDTNAELPAIVDDPRRTFEWGVRNLPPCTTATSPLGWEVGADPAKVFSMGGGAGESLSIASESTKRGKGEVALDFCQWFTAPQNVGAILAEHGGQTPNIIGVEPHPRLAQFVAFSKNTAEYADPWTKLLGRFRDHMFSTSQQLFEGTLDQQAFQESVQAAQLSAANELCGSFQWDVCQQ